MLSNDFILDRVPQNFKHLAQIVKAIVVLTNAVHAVYEDKAEEFRKQVNLINDATYNSNKESESTKRFYEELKMAIEDSKKNLSSAFGVELKF